jgi:ParB-like chromosome segregation protein Spo0J
LEPPEGLQGKESVVGCDATKTVREELDMETRNVGDLRPYEDQARVYGDEPDQEMIESVRQHGILLPLVITKDNVIVSGYRRWASAKKVGLQEVPVTLCKYEAPLDIKDEFIHLNRQRKKTPHQIACEAEVLMEIEQERARRRQQGTHLAGKEKDGTPRQASVVETLPPPSEKGKARDKVGDALGVSGRTVDKMLKVRGAIKEAEQAGDTERAQRLRQCLDDQGVEPAMRLLKEEQDEIVSTPPEQYASIVFPLGVVAMGMAVRELFADDCVVWLWATSKELPDAIALIRSWGCRFGSLLTWAKPRRAPSQTEVLNNQAVYCVVGVRGQRRYATGTGPGNVLVQRDGDDKDTWRQFLQMVEASVPGPKLAVGFDQEGWARIEGLQGPVKF